jgi:hypothetical protein
MKNSTIKWHLARDNQVKLARFCEKFKVRSSHEYNTAQVDGKNYWQMTFEFNNGGFITAEMLQGDTSSYSIADHFQVVDYRLGSMQITHEVGNQEAWVCLCGNTPSDDGFYPCNEQGEEVEPTADWDNLYVCSKCQRVINQNTLEIRT